MKFKSANQHAVTSGVNLREDDVLLFTIARVTRNLFTKYLDSQITFSAAFSC